LKIPVFPQIVLLFKKLEIYLTHQLNIDDVPVDYLKWFITSDANGFYQVFIYSAEFSHPLYVGMDLQKYPQQHILLFWR